jgi:hypothetical protein
MVGSFGLFNKYRDWQTNMTNVKFVNAIVGFIIGPFVYGICTFVDTLVLNTIEFWSGSNPLANNTMTIKGQDGRNYLVKVSRKGYEIKAPTGEITYLIHDEKNDSWSVSQNGEVKEIFRYNADGTVTANLKDGKQLTVGQDEAGLQQVRKAVMGDELFFAMR